MKIETETDAVGALARTPLLPDDHVENRIIALLQREGYPPIDFSCC